MSGLPQASRQVTLTVRLFQRPPMRGQLGWWVHADLTAEGQLQAVLEQAWPEGPWTSDRDWDDNARDVDRDDGTERWLVPVTVEWSL